MLIPYLDLDFLPIPGPGYRGQKGIGSRIWIRNTGLYLLQRLKREKRLRERGKDGGHDFAMLAGAKEEELTPTKGLP
jgi:hypothetical protein